MHAKSLSRLAALLLVGAASSLAHADNQNLGVSATVTQICKFSSAATTLGFGNVDPSSAGPISGTLGNAVTYKCTKGVTPSSLTAGNGLNFSSGRRMKDAVSGDFIPYTLTVALPGSPAGTGFGAGQDKTITVTGSIAATDYQNVSAGSYADTVQLTIAP